MIIMGFNLKTKYEDITFITKDGNIADGTQLELYEDLIRSSKTSILFQFDSKTGIVYGSDHFKTNQEYLIAKQRYEERQVPQVQKVLPCLKNHQETERPKIQYKTLPASILIRDGIEINHRSERSVRDKQKSPLDWYYMDYDEFIQSRRLISYKGQITQKHHIIMKSQGGTNNKKNLIKLSPIDHLRAHWILWRYDKHNKKKRGGFRTTFKNVQKYLRNEEIQEFMRAVGLNKIELFNV